MKKCPECGRMARQKIEYQHGKPYIHWVCVCGYDSGKQKIIYDINTKDTKKE